VVSRFVDARLDATTSRLRTLLIKWAMIAVASLLTSGAYVLISAKLGMPVQNPLTLWLFGSFAILAVGVTSTSLIALLGAMGVLVSLFVFVILGLPSAGATVPLQATPTLFEWQAKFEPMHQVFVGARSLLYLTGQPGSGLSPALLGIAIDLAIGLLLGVLVIRGGPRWRRRPEVPVATASVPEEVPYPGQ
jgi:ABC-type multidrug transport system permease subunit